MSKIAYTDKVAVNVNAGIPDINKVNAADMNEIKNSVNILYDDPVFANSITGSFLTASEMLITDASKKIVSAPVATYPSLTELAYLKGATSNVQTQLNGKTPNDGWIAGTGTWSYSAADSPTFVISINADVTALIGVGDRIKLTQSTGGTKYFIVTVVGAYSGGNTLVTVYGGTDYALTNEAISTPCYSHVKAPFGFTTNPDKWSQSYTNTNDSSTGSVASTATITNWTNHNLSVPIGAWRLSFKIHAACHIDSASGSFQQLVGLSTANNSFSDALLKASNTNISASVTDISSPFYVTKNILVAAKTVYYLNTQANKANCTQYCVGSTATTIIKAECAYL